MRAAAGLARLGADHRIVGKRRRDLGREALANVRLHGVLARVVAARAVEELEGNAAAVHGELGGHVLPGAAADPLVAAHVPAQSGDAQPAAGRTRSSASEAITRSAVARFVASGTLCTLQTRSSARMSGSCGWGLSGSTKK